MLTRCFLSGPWHHPSFVRNIIKTYLRRRRIEIRPSEEIVKFQFLTISCESLICLGPNHYLHIHDPCMYQIPIGHLSAWFVVRLLPLADDRVACTRYAQLRVRVSCAPFSALNRIFRKVEGNDRWHMRILFDTRKSCEREKNRRRLI